MKKILLLLLISFVLTNTSFKQYKDFLKDPKAKKEMNPQKKETELKDEKPSNPETPEEKEKKSPDTEEEPKKPKEPKKEKKEKEEKKEKKEKQIKLKNNQSTKELYINKNSFRSTKMSLPFIRDYPSTKRLKK